MKQKYRIVIYKTNNGKEPYVEWINKLDSVPRARIKARITRIIETGSLGVYEPVKEGVYELKLDFGPGYRVYFGFDEKTSLLLLFGGHKKTQNRDINKAVEYWKHHLLQEEDFYGTL